MKASILILLFSFTHLAMPNSCERFAYIDYEKVLIDSSSSIKGDGLKHLLAQDPKALAYLETYQKNGKPSTDSAIISTIGLALGAGGYLFGKDSKSVFNKNILLGAGIGILISNFFYNKTKRTRNEKNLLNAIYEYNLRNTPKIYFTPYKNGKNSDSIGVGIGINKGF